MTEEIKKEKYVEVDKNLAIETSFPETDVRFHSVRHAPFELYNFYDPQGSRYSAACPRMLRQQRRMASPSFAARAPEDACASPPIRSISLSRR